MRPPLNEATMRKAIDDVLKYGSVSEAARQTGKNRQTLQELVTRARVAFPDLLPGASFSGGWAAVKEKPPRETPPEFTAPVLPSEDEDLDTLIARQIDDHERRQKARTAAEWMPFAVHGDEPFALVFVGDPHVDTCDLGLLCKHIETVEQTPRMWAVGLGDWCNAWVGRLRGQYAAQSMTERDAYRLVRWLLQKPIWFAVLLGNHNGGRWHGDGAPIKWMETASATPIREWQVKFSVRCGGASWKIWAAHNFPGNSQFNANHGLDKRALHTGAMADLYVAGDRHTFKLSQDQHEHTGRMFWSARARGYKPLDLYAEEMGYNGQTMGHSIGAVFDPRTGNLTCFADVKETAAYLTFLRLRRLAA